MRRLKQVNDVLMFLSDLCNVLILLLGDFFQIVVMEKTVQTIRSYVPGFRQLDFGEFRMLVHVPLQYPPGEIHPGTFATKFAMTVDWMDQTGDKLNEILDFDMVLGNLDEFKLVAEETTDHRYFQTFAS
ncbi:hypothetical protein BMS3Bbin04_01329 [bacterium BMS3Bbin04]|nr:hypothetical protein BMS3Bbin04_01329 [bacterium BMS3Bbin04]